MDEIEAAIGEEENMLGDENDDSGEKKTTTPKKKTTRFLGEGEDGDGFMPPEMMDKKQSKKDAEMAAAQEKLRERKRHELIQHCARE